MKLLTAVIFCWVSALSTLWAQDGSNPDQNWGGMNLDQNQSPSPNPGPPISTFAKSLLQRSSPAGETANTVVYEL